uniref:G-protein coupled receptors family 1 profile domain-containing protein n=1 Tax=Salvator merianae TaxID=96440 RepID=A0A8D0BE22_SALMN
IPIRSSYTPDQGFNMEANSTALESTNLSLLLPSNSKTDVSRAMDIVRACIYSAVLILGSLGNGMVIWITACQTSRTVNCVWFFHLAVADFLFSMSRILPFLRYAFFEDWPFGSFLCRANTFIKYLNMFCSVFLLATISVDRAALVTYPIWTKNHRAPRLAWFAALGVWFMAVATSLPFYFYRNVIRKDNKTKCYLVTEGRDSIKLTLCFLRLFCGFLAPFAIIIICYGIITIVLRSRQATLRSNKPFKVILAIVVTFFLCWAPYHFFVLLECAKVNMQFLSVGLPLASCLAYLNSCANPILYFFIGLDYHKKLGHLNLVAAFRRALLEDSAYSLTKSNKERRQEISSTNELDSSTAAEQVL